MDDQYYRAARLRTCELVADLNAAELGQRIPACPKWSVRDLLAHQVGLAADVVTGNTAGSPGDEWTAAQVGTRTAATVEELVEEWQRVGATVEERMRQGGWLVLVHDVLCHEADLRGALGLGRPPRQSWLPSLEVLVEQAEQRVGGQRRLVIHTDERQYEIGSGEPVTTLEVPAFELWRGLLGRRSRSQLANWWWLPDANNYLDLLPVFPPNRADLLEPA